MITVFVEKDIYGNIFARVEFNRVVSGRGDRALDADNFFIGIGLRK
jgi:hypothetical protein